MFDYVKYETECPYCKKVINGFQTKDAKDEEQLLRDLSVDDIEDNGTFYTACKYCKEWVEFVIKAPQKDRMIELLD